MIRYCLLFISIFALKFALLQAQVPGDLEQYQLQYNPGYTLVSIYSYQVKLVGEQRTTDNMVQLIVMPKEQGIQFHVENVDFVILPQSETLGGPVAQLDGLFSVQVSQGYSTQILKTVPVEISTVDQFSISSDEATIQGYQVVQKQLASLLQQMQ